MPIRVIRSRNAFWRLAPVLTFFVGGILDLFRVGNAVRRNVTRNLLLGLGATQSHIALTRRPKENLK